MSSQIRIFLTSQLHSLLQRTATRPPYRPACHLWTLSLFSSMSFCTRVAGCTKCSFHAPESKTAYSSLLRRSQCLLHYTVLLRSKLLPGNSWITQHHWSVFRMFLSSQLISSTGDAPHWAPIYVVLKYSFSAFVVNIRALGVTLMLLAWN